MKAFRNVDTLIQFTDGFQAYYNYLKPHYSLLGKTPAEAAKVDYDIKTWTDIVRLPISKHSELGSHKRIRKEPLPRISKPMPKISERPRRLR
jgi:hypothetical protein